MAVKIICLIICALLLFVCYSARFFAEKILRRREPSEKMLQRIKLCTLIASIILFVIVMVFVQGSAHNI